MIYLKKKINLKLNDYLILILLILFFVGYFGVFSLLSKFLPKIIIYLILLIIWIITMKNQIKNGIKSFKKEYFKDALSIVVLILIVSSLLFSFGSKYIESDMQLKGSVPLALFSSLIFAPIVEELMNRCAIGMILEKFTNNNIIINIITTIIFVFLHLYKMNINIVALFIYALIYFMLGYACGYYYRKTNNIVLPMLIHFIWNFYMIIGVAIRNIIGSVV